MENILPENTGEVQRNLFWVFFMLWHNMYELILVIEAYILYCNFDLSNRNSLSTDVSSVFDTYLMQYWEEAWTFFLIYECKIFSWIIQELVLRIIMTIWNCDRQIPSHRFRELQNLLLLFNSNFLIEIYREQVMIYLICIVPKDIWKNDK